MEQPEVVNKSRPKHKGVGIRGRVPTPASALVATTQAIATWNNKLLRKKYAPGTAYARPMLSAAHKITTRLLQLLLRIGTKM
jgi:hypothetical protein